MTRKRVNLRKWYFSPRKYLFPHLDGLPLTENRLLKVPGWSALDLIVDEAELAAINKATGTEYLGGAGNEFLTPLFGTQSVFTIDHEMHRLARKLSMPALSRKKVDSMHPLVVDIVRSQLDCVMMGSAMKIGHFFRLLANKIAYAFVISPKLETENVSALHKALEKATG